MLHLDHLSLGANSRLRSASLAKFDRGHTTASNTKCRLPTWSGGDNNFEPNSKGYPKDQMLHLDHLLLDNYAASVKDDRLRLTCRAYVHLRFKVRPPLTFLWASI